MNKSVEDAVVIHISCYVVCDFLCFYPGIAHGYSDGSGLNHNPVVASVSEGHVLRYRYVIVVQVGSDSGDLVASCGSYVHTFGAPAEEIAVGENGVKPAFLFLRDVDHTEVDGIACVFSDRMPDVRGVAEALDLVILGGVRVHAVFFDEDGVQLFSVEEIKQSFEGVSGDGFGTDYITLCIKTELSVHRHVTVESYGEDFGEMLQFQHVATCGQNAPDSFFLQDFYGVLRALGYRFCLVGIERVVEVEENGLDLSSRPGHG